MANSYQICACCGKEFKTTPSRLRGVKNPACSRECRGILESDKHNKRVERSCVICGKSCFYSKRKAKNIKNASCSKECASKVLSQTRVGIPRKPLGFNPLETFFWHKHIQLRYRSSVKKLPFDLDHIFLIDLYVKQEGKCYYSGIPMRLDSADKMEFDLLSVDRIVPELGYTKGNIVYCLLCINMLKGKHSLDKLSIVFKAIADKNNIHSQSLVAEIPCDY